MSHERGMAPGSRLAPFSSSARPTPKADQFVVRDSGKRKEFETGMVRDVTDGKVAYDLVFDGPLLERYATHMTAGAGKYQKRNWMKAATQEEYERFRESAIRHFFQYLKGDREEDHFAATVFNLNGMEFVRERLDANR